MDGGRTLAPHPSITAVAFSRWGGERSFLMWWPSTPATGCSTLASKVGHHNGNRRMSTMAGVQVQAIAIAMSPRLTSGRPDPRPSTPVGFLLGLLNYNGCGIHDHGCASAQMQGGSEPKAQFAGWLSIIFGVRLTYGRHRLAVAPPSDLFSPMQPAGRY